MLRYCSVELKEMKGASQVKINSCNAVCQPKKTLATYDLLPTADCRLRTDITGNIKFIYAT